MKRTPALIAALLLLLPAACDQQAPEQIKWQMPLESPDDPHAGSKQPIHIPAWASAQQGSAQIVWLQKTTTKTFTSDLSMGEQVSQPPWQIRLLGLASGLRLKNNAFINDKNVDNAAALVEISRNGKVLYRGWLYEKFPEMFGLDDPEWKVWVKHITIRPASPETTGSLSSAG